jgi:tetratricopeptide (TPR) repeat protein
VPFGAFQYDDFSNIVLEPSTQQLAQATGLRPLLRLSYFLDHALWGMRAHGFLLTNLLLHLGCVMLVYALALAPPRNTGASSRLGLGGAAAAFLAAALFALEPAHAEVVAYASGRSAGLATALLLAGLVLRARGRSRFALAAFVAACLAKETALVFPLLVGLWERDARASVRLALPALALGAAFVAVPRYRELADFSLGARGPLEALALNLSVLPEQLSLWLRPWALSVEHAVALPPSAAAVLAGAALAAALLGVTLLAWRPAPLAALATGWLLFALLPTSSFVARADPISERALYLAWVGPALALGALLARARERAPRLVSAAALLLLALGGAASFARARVWSDERALWRDAVAKAPESARAWNNLGMAHFSHEEWAEADAALRRALALDPANPRAQSNLHELAIVCGERCP